MAEGLRIWTLPDPDAGGINANDMQLLGVGIAFYVFAASPPPPPSVVPISGGGFYPYLVFKEKMEPIYNLKERILQDDQEILELFIIIEGGTE